MTLDMSEDKALEAALVDAETADDEHADAPVETFFNKEGNALIAPLARYLISKRSVKTITGVKRDMFVYREGRYVTVEDILRKDTRKLFGAVCTNKHVNEVIEMIRDLTTMERGAFTEPVHLINLNNGVYDLKTGTLGQHDPRYLFLTKLPVNYDPSADCPVIKKYLTDVLDDEYVTIVQELAGYGLHREYHIKKAFILFGDGDTGKTTLVTLLFTFFGASNVSGLSLQKLTHDKFACAHLYEKYINIYDDLSSKDIEDNGAFKIATGGGIISGEKKFKDPFQFKNFSKLIFACNKIPDVKEATDDAYFNRWIVLPFTRIIDEDKQDKGLIHKMTTDEELSGFLNFALLGLKRLLEQQRFSYDKDVNEIKTAMMRSASSIASFAQDAMENVEGVWVSRDDLYHAYTTYCDTNGLSIAGKKAFGGRLPLLAPYVADCKPKDPKTGKQVTAWRNVKLRIKDYKVDTSEDIFEFPEEDPPKLIS